MDIKEIEKKHKAKLEMYKCTHKDGKRDSIRYDPDTKIEYCNKCGYSFGSINLDDVYNNISNMKDTIQNCKLLIDENDENKDYYIEKFSNLLVELDIFNEIFRSLNFNLNKQNNMHIGYVPSGYGYKDFKDYMSSFSPDGNNGFPNPGLMLMPQLMEHIKNNKEVSNTETSKDKDESSSEKEDISPCIKKKCSDRASCCGCPEYFEWVERNKEKNR